MTQFAFPSSNGWRSIILRPSCHARVKAMAKRASGTIAQRLDDLIEMRMKKAGRLVPARLQSALALLERLREHPSLQLGDHRAGEGSSGLKSHEGFGKSALNRFGLKTVVKVFGRRSSNLQEWGQSLLDILKASGFAELSADDRSALIDSAQASVAARLRSFHEEEPLLVSIHGGSAEHVIREVLRQAEMKGKSGDVAQYLVGAKLALRFNRDVPSHGANRPDRRSFVDREARSGDFEIANAVIEVAIGLPDDKHFEQIEKALGKRDSEIWLLTRADRVEQWKREVASRFTDRHDASRIIVASVDAFVGQNISELAEFSVDGKTTQLQALFQLYNSRLDTQVVAPGIRIDVKL
ncbi:MAG: DUF4928 family protein [Pirellulales bacterium]